MADTDAVHAAITELGLAHRAYRAERQQAMKERRELISSWTKRAYRSLMEMEESLTHDDGEPLNGDEIDELLTDHLYSSDEVLDLPDGAGVEFGEVPQLRQQLRELDDALRTAESTLQRPQAEVAARLKAWLGVVRAEPKPSDSVDQWPAILRSWRQVLDMTTREAAKQLEVSPAAIVRYEKDPDDPGGRTPKLPNIAAMIERMATVPPFISDSAKRASAESIVAHWDGITATELIDNLERQQEELAVSIQDALPQLTFRQLQLLEALATDHQAIEALLNWVDEYGNDPLRPVFEAAVTRGVRKSNDPEEG